MAEGPIFLCLRYHILYMGQSFALLDQNQGFKACQTVRSIPAGQTIFLMPRPSQTHRIRPNGPLLGQTAVFRLLFDANGYRVKGNLGLRVYGFRGSWGQAKTYLLLQDFLIDYLETGSFI